MLIFQKNVDVRGKGGLKIWTHVDKGEGVKMFKSSIWMVPNLRVYIHSLFLIQNFT